MSTTINEGNGTLDEGTPEAKSDFSKSFSEDLSKMTTEEKIEMLKDMQKMSLVRTIVDLHNVYSASFALRDEHPLDADAEFLTALSNVMVNVFVNQAKYLSERDINSSLNKYLDHITTMLPKAVTNAIPKFQEEWAKGGN